MEFSRLPVRSVGEHPLNPFDRREWPATLPPVATLLDDGLELGAATVFVGENGAGKSTLVEAIAQVVLSTHSPLLAALPGATVYEVGEWGLRERPWMDLALVDRWTQFLLDPERFIGDDGLDER